MIVTLTPNPAIDVTITTPSVDQGNTNVIPAARRRAGGKAINVARVLADEGYETRAIAPVGAENLDWFARDLGATPHTLVPCAEPTRSSYAIVESTHDTTTVLNERGAARTTQEWDAVLSAVAETAAGAKVLVMSGSIPPESPDDVVEQVVQIGHDAGCQVVLDVAGQHLLTAARAGADVVKPNIDELRGALGEIDPLDGARELQQLGARLVVVSLGADGLLVVPDTGQPVRARLATPLRGNPTGAGDAAVAAICALLDSGVQDASEIARLAVTWSAAAVLEPHAGSIHPDRGALERAVELDNS